MVQAEIDKIKNENSERIRINKALVKSYDEIMAPTEMDPEARMVEDFYFWAAKYVRIKPKGGGKDIPFVANRPQRKLIEALEKMRVAEKPIRLLLLKARQWGGSTAVQMYMAWLQMVHSTGLNSLIIAHQKSASEEIKDMFDRMIASYGITEADDPDRFNSPYTIRRVGTGGSCFRVEPRKFKVRLGTAERPHGVRGGDYSLVHLSEVGLWKKTLTRTPEDLMRSATSGVLLKPLTMIVMESTANGVGTFFHKEYLASKKGESQYKALFIPWFYIDGYTLPVKDYDAFIRWLLKRKDDNTGSERRASGKYLWWLWNKGATLEAINWYIEERKKYSSQGAMSSEYPSNDIEAFAYSGKNVFSTESIERMRQYVKEPSMKGELNERGDFISDTSGHLTVWTPPCEPEPEVRWIGRYLAVVDIGGRSDKSDYSVITVLDRLGQEGLPEVVAQWRGHTDFDLLADNSARIAGWYHDAILVIESNTLETHDPQRDVDENPSPYLLNMLGAGYPNLYKRKTNNGTIRPGFHTNRQTKPLVISAMVKAVREGLYIERDSEALNELTQYERRPNGSYGARPGCHDDILMTRAIGLYLDGYELPPPRREIRRISRSRPIRLKPGLSFGF